MTARRPGVPVGADAACRPAVRDVAEVLAERRRAARAAEVAAQGLPPGSPIPRRAGGPVTAPNMPPAADGEPEQRGSRNGKSVYQRYQQPRR